jgi:AbrB family looped-hinge helix DNA binding protein
VNAIVEIDRSGRVVVPKKFRDALHLGPGTRLKVEIQGENLAFSPAMPEAQIRVEDGTPLIFSAGRSNPEKITVEMVNESIAHARRGRERRILGLDSEEE